MEIKEQNDILSLFHHIHHKDGEHEVHHCGGRHAEIDGALDYEIFHCECGKHAINVEYAVGHATGKNLENLVMKIEFIEQCPNGGWHVESGIESK